MANSHISTNLGSDASGAYVAQAFKYYGVAVCILYLCDFIETFSAEVKYMWKCERWNTARVLYFWSRYLPIVEIPLVFSLYIPDMAPQICYSLNVSLLVISWIAEAFPIAILFLCLYALFGSKRTLFPACWGSYTFLMVVLLSTLIVYVSHLVVPATSLDGGCYTYGTPFGDQFMLVNRLLRLSVHLVMMILACLKGWSRSQELKSPLMRAIHSGGMAYYGGIFLMAVVDIVACYFSSVDLSKPKSLTFISRFGAPILANRLLLRMYKEAHRRTETVAIHSVSGLRFSHRPLTARSRMDVKIPARFDFEAQALAKQLASMGSVTSPISVGEPGLMFRK